MLERERYVCCLAKKIIFHFVILALESRSSHPQLFEPNLSIYSFTVSSEVGVVHILLGCALSVVG